MGRVYPNIIEMKSQIIRKSLIMENNDTKQQQTRQLSSKDTYNGGIPIPEHLIDIIISDYELDKYFSLSWS